MAVPLGLGQRRLGGMAIKGANGAGGMEYNHRKQMVVTVLYLLLYLGVGAIFYVAVEDWTFIDAIYFAVVTMSTVGYGDLDATTDGSKVLTMFYIAVGVLVVFVPVSKVIAGYQAMAERKLAKLAEARHSKLYSAKSNSNLFDGEGASSDCSNRPSLGPVGIVARPPPTSPGPAHRPRLLSILPSCTGAVLLARFSVVSLSRRQR